MNPSRPVVAGVLSAAAGLAVGEAIAAVLDVRESPLLAVGQGVIALTPGPIAEAIIGVVGTADKPLAVTSVVIAVLALGGVAGRWWDVRRVRSMILVALLVAGASVAVLVRPYSSAPGVFAAVAGGTAMIVVLQLFAVANHETSNVPKGGRDRGAGARGGCGPVVGCSSRPIDDPGGPPGRRCIGCRAG
ncbi:MAG: hypothetical protein WCB95_00870, partial [Aeromicrobium sp.]